MTTLVERFRQQVARRPESCAVSDGAERLTYAELDARSEQLAQRLQAQGARPETLVGVALPRSADLVVALLAVLKTGAAYLPLDPAYPAARLAHLIVDAAPVSIVTTAGVELPQGHEDAARILLPDSVSRTDHASPVAPVAPVIHPDSAAYVIYTSGSTGQPKGVVVSHRAFLGLLDATVPQFDISAQDVWTVFHSYAFDFSVWEIWAPLLTGGQAVIVPQEATWSAEDLLTLMEREAVTVLNQTPTAFAALAKADAQGKHTLADLRLVIFGGEALEPARLRDWFVRRPMRPRMVNMYGITETTVHVTAYDMKPDQHGAAGESPIGHPLPGFHGHVLGADLQPVAMGAVGELYLGGAQVSRGYLRRAGLTASRFVADPAGGGGRLYRSGDLVRCSATGLDFIGRADAQLSLRGFRIEPGEVEAALEAHADVSASAVAVKPDPDGTAGEQCLVAYVVTTQADLDRRALRDHLAARLPKHLIPAHIVALPKLPLTPNNKLDRTALPTPAPRSDRSTKQSAPSRETLLRRRLAQHPSPVAPAPKKEGNPQ